MNETPQRLKTWTAPAIATRGSSAVAMGTSFPRRGVAISGVAQQLLGRTVQSAEQ